MKSNRLTGLFLFLNYIKMHHMMREEHIDSDVVASESQENSSEWKRMGLAPYVMLIKGKVAINSFKEGRGERKIGM